MKKTLGLDLEGVLADSVSQVCKKLSFHEGYEVKKEDLFDWDITKCLKNIFISQMDILDLFHDVWDKPEEIAVEEPDIRKTVLGLKRFFNISVISTCVHHTGAVKWLENRGIPYDNLILIRSSGEDKNAYNLDTLVDDRPGTMKWHQFYKSSIDKIILREQPWNKNDKDVSQLIKDHPNKYSRIGSLSEFLASVQFGVGTSV